MEHPAYSHNVAPRDYWLNGYMKHNLIHRPSEKSLAHTVSKLMKTILEKGYRKNFEKLLGRMELCINNRGDYFEHLIK